MPNPYNTYGCWKCFPKQLFFSLSFLVQHVFLPSKWNTLLSAHLSFWILPPVVNRNLRIDKESTQNVFKGRASFYSKLWTVIDEFWFEPKIYLLLHIQGAASNFTEVLRLWCLLWFRSLCLLLSNVALKLEYILSYSV